MSLARNLIAQGIACGIGINAYSEQTTARSIYIAPSSARTQIEVIADQLADISKWPSLPYTTLLHSLGRRIPPTTSLIALSARDGEDFTAVLRRLATSGRDVRLTAIGRNARDATARARAVGIAATQAKLEPNWRTADAIELVR
jgi:hypothetical protein